MSWSDAVTDLSGQWTRDEFGDCPMPFAHMGRHRDRDFVEQYLGQRQDWLEVKWNLEPVIVVASDVPLRPLLRIMLNPGDPSAPLIALLEVFGPGAIIVPLADYARTRRYLAEIELDLHEVDGDVKMSAVMPLATPRLDFAYAMGYVAARHLGTVYAALEAGDPLPVDPEHVGIDWLRTQRVDTDNALIWCDRHFSSWVHGTPGVDLLHVLQGVTAADLHALLGSAGLPEGELQLSPSSTAIRVGARGQSPLELCVTYNLDELQETLYDEAYGDDGYDITGSDRVRELLSNVAATYGPDADVEWLESQPETLGDVGLTLQVDDRRLVVAVCLAECLADLVNERLRPVIRKTEPAGDEAAAPVHDADDTDLL